MNTENLTAFLATAALLTMAPGLDTALVLRSAAADGLRHGALTAVGIAAGCLCWGTAAAFGLNSLLQAWPLAFDGLRWAGALYLGWLGARLLINPRQSLAVDPGAAFPVVNGITAVRRGFMTNVLNPKVGLFYLTLLPQFVPDDTVGGGYALVLACLHVLIALIWFSLLSILTQGLQFWLRRPGTMRRLDRLTGCAFVALGAHMTLTAGFSA
ncbi:LysE family translocator [Sphingomonas arantia]|uniref:LysE family translocator n=1 Tax=Sphingomonas arantia TaxID=1460676 RepID=A0ABW4U102_9SPHN